MHDYTGSCVLQTHSFTVSDCLYTYTIVWTLLYVLRFWCLGNQNVLFFSLDKNSCKNSFLEIICYKGINFVFTVNVCSTPAVLLQ
jgi:hypothetical protein